LLARNSNYSKLLTGTLRDLQTQQDPRKRIRAALAFAVGFNPLLARRLTVFPSKDIKSPRRFFPEKELSRSSNEITEDRSVNPSEVELEIEVEIWRHAGVDVTTDFVVICDVGWKEVCSSASSTSLLYLT
jgi:hypothetical protein